MTLRSEQVGPGLVERPIDIEYYKLAAGVKENQGSNALVLTSGFDEILRCEKVCWVLWYDCAIF